ncbi:branched-chain amino acid ABC transporter permease [Magnetospirillum sp. SS-4]|uniref:branched-chain amino acid ABC transporter permease n=1 Tax=Magnetospirillum sp. SS-4 TaxID=2681465 RepID=UPI0013846433|nr:branched-chain amino acid ABC transporter permease [Magnetospirillum sp. SS-4]CAA7626141.1 ABC-type branched-chain amino acid transport system protein [Magnetospirillum sp. SS-4]
MNAGTLFSSRSARLLLGLLAVLSLAPLGVDDYTLSILIAVLLQAYLGMSWNVMMGFAGQFSLGHALYIGLGAYAAGALFIHFGVSPWIGVFAGMTVSVAVSSVIGMLGFRFKVMGVYFALLTIAFAEFTRVLFDHWGWVGASSGLVLPVTNRVSDDFWLLRGSTSMFYYLILAMTVAGFLFSRSLLMRRIGYYWQAIRENEDAADALGIPVFRYKMIAVVISAAMTSVGGMFIAFFSNNLFPESIFSMHRSLELILGPIIGGVGTLFGPILGAVILTAMGETFTILGEHVGIDGVKQIAYGICLLAILIVKPNGVWPWLRHRLGLDGDGK